MRFTARTRRGFSRRRARRLGLVARAFFSRRLSARAAEGKAAARAPRESGGRPVSARTARNGESANRDNRCCGRSGETPADSTEVGRIVPIYEAIGAISSRMLRRIIYAILQDFEGNISDPLPRELCNATAFQRAAMHCSTRTSLQKMKTWSC